VNILLTGSDGFIGKNLFVHINNNDKFTLSTFTRNNTIKSLFELVSDADAVIHLAGENRPTDNKAFIDVNINLTQKLCEAIKLAYKNIPIIFASSIQANMNNPYGKSKYEAEIILKEFSLETGNTVHIYRLPNVFGKWCKPNYNSVVATFCFNIANNLPIHINDKSTILKLVYIDDVVEDFIKMIQKENYGVLKPKIQPEYKISLEKLAEQINLFKSSRTSLVSEPVGDGLVRALYSTYVSYLSPENFVYDLQSHIDERGSFIEMLKTKNNGQFSFFTANQGVTRGGHYHHSKSEKFLVVKGSARFRFRHIQTNEVFEIYTSGNKPQFVDTIPGWAHEITNIGESEMIVFLWANEIFNRHRPDTFKAKV